MRASDRRRLLSALALSLALHLAAGLLAVRLLREPPPAPRPAPIELTLVEVPPVHRPPERPPPPAAPVRPASPGPGARRHGGGAPGSSSAGPRAAAPANPPEAPAPAPGGSPPTPWVAPDGPGWLEAEGLAPGEAARGRPGTVRVPGIVHGGSQGQPGGPAGDAEAGVERAPGPPGDEPVAVRAARVKDRLDGYLQEVLAADRALRLPDAYWARLGRRFDAAFHVEWSVLERGDSADAVVTGSRLWQALVAWKEVAEAWARDGAAPGPPGSPRGALGRLTFPDVTDTGAKALLVTELVTRVELVQAPDGAFAGWRVVGPSGNRVHDEMVLARLRALAEAGDAPGPVPEQGRRTTWAVRTRFVMVPPLPLVGCSFDANFRPAGCFYPLKRMVNTRVELERVWKR